MRPVSLRVLPLLIRPAVRAMPWAAFLAAAGTGLAIVGVPAAFPVTLSAEDLVSLLRAAAVCGALGVAFLLDDPAARTVATVPTARPVRYAARAAVVLPSVTVWWALVVAVTAGGAEDRIGATLPLGGVTLEAAALGAAALAVSAARLRSGGVGGGVVAAPVVLALVVTATRMPPELAFYVPPHDGRWDAAHDRWGVLLAAALAGSVWAGVEPLSGVRRSGRWWLIRARNPDLLPARRQR
jgi:hypothetical protein